MLTFVFLVWVCVLGRLQRLGPDGGSRDRVSALRPRAFLVGAARWEEDDVRSPIVAARRAALCGAPLRQHGEGVREGSSLFERHRVRTRGYRLRCPAS